MDSPKIRRYDIDWLRVIVIFIIFLLHVGCIFDTRTQIARVLRSNELSPELTFLTDLFIDCIMS
jgi:hypothetical protein